MDYITLAGAKSTVGSLKYWVNHEYLPVDEIITDAQNEVYSRLRAREMQVQSNLSIGLGTSTLAVPSGFLDPFSLQDQYGADVILRDPRVLNSMRALDASQNLISGPISNYAIVGTALLFDMKSNVATTFTLIFYQQPAALSPSNSTNFLTTRYSHLFRAALLKHAYAFRKAWDEAQKYAAELEARFQEIEVNDDLAARGLNDPEEFE